MITRIEMIDNIIEEVINSFNAGTTNKYYLPEITIAQYRSDMDAMIGFLKNLKEVEESKMVEERMGKRRQKILRECWNKRNPAHDVDSNGVDRFWGTVLRVLEDYEDALMLPYVEKPFFCSNDKISIRCEKQCLGCYNLKEREENE